MGCSRPHRVSAQRRRNSRRAQKELHLQDHPDAEPRRRDLRQLPLLAARLRPKPEVDGAEQAPRPDDLLREADDESVSRRTRSQAVLRPARPLAQEERVHVRLRVRGRREVGQLHVARVSVCVRESQQSLQVQAVQLPTGEEQRKDRPHRLFQRARHHVLVYAGDVVLRSRARGR